MARDNAGRHEDAEVEDGVRAAAGRLVLPYPPAYSPRLDPIEMPRRHFRREVTHCELFESVKALLVAATDFCARYNREPQQMLAVIGSQAAKAV